MLIYFMASALETIPTEISLKSHTEAVGGDRLWDGPGHCVIEILKRQGDRSF